jgi:hypothetical protein
MDEYNDPVPSSSVEETLARLEKRLARIELALGMSETPVPARAAAADAARAGGELEMVVGQNLFAKVGILVLAIGVALAMSLPWPELPPALPSVVGWALAACLLALAQWLQGSIPLLARYFRGAGMVLLFFATLRLSYFGARPVFAAASPVMGALLAVAAAVNLGIAWWRKTVFQLVMALFTGYAAALAVGTPWYVFGMVTALSLYALLAARRFENPWLVVAATPLAFLTYLIWAIGDPVVGNKPEVVSGPFAGVVLLLVWMSIHAAAMIWRRNRIPEDPVLLLGSLLNCGGYTLFLAHVFIRYREVFIAANVAASMLLLGIAVIFWVREQSRGTTFIYAMTGYAALNMALIKAFPVPELFAWLSAQSLLVVTTAIWFRSRFIIIANFLIYLVVVACYMALVKQETGISLVFGVVALTSARILHWKKDRLELKTEFMRNAYLATAFVVFPYALYHLVPRVWVAVSWVGLALFYYLMNLLTESHKYRWLGHNTLLLTVVYILVVGVARLEGAQRIMSFLLLGTVLLVVSVIFSIVRNRSQRGCGGGSEANSKPPTSPGP